MAFRGRGRGRGGGGGFFQYAKQEPFVLFPENVTLPSVSDTPEEHRFLISGNQKLLYYWKASSFYLEENPTKKMPNAEIERFSDRSKSNSKLNRDQLGQILQLTSRNFPEELIEGFKGKVRTNRKIQWNPKSGLEKLDFLEKHEESLEGRDKADKDKKGDEDEDEDEDGEEENNSESDEYSDDYNQNDDVDDDEDDYNMEDDGGDEPEY